MTLLKNSRDQDLMLFVTKPGVGVASDHYSDGEAELYGAERLGMEMMWQSLQGSNRRAQSVLPSEALFGKGKNGDARASTCTRQSMAALPSSKYGQIAPHDLEKPLQIGSRRMGRC